MVELAGVEPASENKRTKSTTSLDCLLFLGHWAKNRRNTQQQHHLNLVKGPMKTQLLPYDYDAMHFSRDQVQSRYSSLGEYWLSDEATKRVCYSSFDFAHNVCTYFFVL